MPDSTSAAPGPLLLCIDLQSIFIGVMSDGAGLLRRCSFAIEAAQGLGVAVAFTEQVPQKLGTTVPGLLALVPQPRQFGKVSFSAMADDGIRAALNASGADHLILCGLETPVCVYQTAIDAINAGLPVTLLSDCLGARRPDDAAAALETLRRAGANVLPSETVFYSMLHDAKHPFFKTLTQLVKKYG
jgi:isochorismate hydrolase